MTTLREAAQVALDRLDFHIRYTGLESDRVVADRLRAALAQPEPKPGTEYERGYDEGLNDVLRNGLDWARRYFGGEQQPDPEPVAWHVVGPDGTLHHAAGWKEAAHEHINDAINEHDLLEAADWRVVPVYLATPTIEAAVAAERERCAQIAETHCPGFSDSATKQLIADAIRDTSFKE